MRVEPSRRHGLLVAGVVAAVLAVAVVVVRATAADDEPPTREQRVRALAGVDGLRAVGDPSGVVLMFDRDASAGQVRRALATTATLLRHGEQWFVSRSPVRAGRMPARALLVDRDSDPADLARLILAVDALPPAVSSVSTFNGAALPVDLSVGTTGDLPAVAATIVRAFDEFDTGALVQSLVISPQGATGDDAPRVEVRCDRDLTRAVPTVDRLAGSAAALEATVRSARIRDCDRLSTVDIEVDDVDEAVAAHERLGAERDAPDLRLTLGDLSVFGDDDPRRAIALARALARVGTVDQRVGTDLGYVEAKARDPEALARALEAVADARPPRDARVRITANGPASGVEGSPDRIVSQLGPLRRLDRAGYLVSLTESSGSWRVRVSTRELAGGGPLPDNRPEKAGARARLVALLRDLDLPGEVSYSLPDYGSRHGTQLVFSARDGGRASEDQLLSRSGPWAGDLLSRWNELAEG